MSSNDDSASTPKTGKKPTLSECILAQHNFTMAAVLGTTAFSYFRRPSTAIGVLLVMGSLGTACDFAYGYFVACEPQRKEWERQRQEEERQQEELLRKQQQKFNSPQQP